MSELTGGWGWGGAVLERTACTKALWSVGYETFFFFWYETSEVRKPACMSRVQRIWRVWQGPDPRGLAGQARKWAFNSRTSEGF